MSRRVIDEFPVGPSARVYAEGWQSWSPTTWLSPQATSRKPASAWEHTMRFRPGADIADVGLQAEGLLVVDPGNGDVVRCYGTSDPTSAVSSVRAHVVEGALVVTADGDVRCTTATSGEDALTAYGDALARRLRPGELRAAPTVWCSWYRYFERLSTGDVLENLTALEEHELPVEVVQLDDGWSRGLGEGLAPGLGVPDLEPVVDAIRASGRKAGVWLAPFLVGADTTLAADHPDWVVGDAGYNWGQRLVGLDVTHPAFCELLAGHVSRLSSLGVEYLKLDFLYAGALPGRRHEDVSAVAAYRAGVELVREAAGPGVYLLGCGAPILPSVGLVDAMRVSPDTFHEVGQDGSRGLRGLMPLAARAWQQGRFWVNDPDCVVARPSFALREQWAEAAIRYGGLRSVSDCIRELDAWGLECTRRVLVDPPPPRPFAPEVVAAAAQTAASLVELPVDSGAA